MPGLPRGRLAGEWTGWMGLGIAMPSLLLEY